MSSATSTSPPPSSPSKLKQAGMQVASGGSAGFVEVLLMHPLDLVKTRLQLQTSKQPTAAVKIGGNGAVKPPLHAVYYNGMFDCMAKMYRHEGVLSYWKGIVPPILAETPKRATKFLCFEQYKRLFLFGSDKPTPLTFSLAGFGAGLTEAIVVNPFEVVKVRMQANRSRTKNAPTTWMVTKQIVQDDGFGSKGLNKGLTATMCRNGSFNMIYFGFYYSVKDFFPAHQDPVYEFLRKIGIGFLSGSFASIFNIPFDVAKSRIQGPQPVAGQIKYKSTMKSIVLVAREEGVAALYKGLLPKVMRLGPGGAIMMLVYEYVYEYLEHKLS